jgi:hypothetical protein
LTPTIGRGSGGRESWIVSPAAHRRTASLIGDAEAGYPRISAELRFRVSGPVYRVLVVPIQHPVADQVRDIVDAQLREVWW